MLFVHQIENQYRMPIFSTIKEKFDQNKIDHSKHTGFSRLTLQENVPSNTSSRFIVA